MIDIGTELDLPTGIWTVIRVDENCTQNLPYKIKQNDTTEWISEEQAEAGLIIQRNYVVGDEGYFEITPKNTIYISFKDVKNMYREPEEVKRAWFEYYGADYEELERIST